MAARTMSGPVAAPAKREFAVRKIGREDLRASLREGLNDFLSLRGDILFAGLLYPLIGFAAAVLTINGHLLPLFLPIAAGIGLLGPVAAVGFYELARRREDGIESNWRHFLDVTKRPAFEDICVVAGLLLVIFGAWVTAAGGLYVALFGWKVAGTIPGFLAQIFTTPEGWALIIIGLAIGLVFAATVLAISVVSLPMLVDCDVSARDAVVTSFRAARENKSEMVMWGLIVAGLLVAGSIPLFIGLAVVLPWLGYSTWHLYTRLVDRRAVTTRRRTQRTPA